MQDHLAGASAGVPPLCRPRVGAIELWPRAGDCFKGGPPERRFVAHFFWA